MVESDCNKSVYYMEKLIKNYEKLYNWEELKRLVEKFTPEIVNSQIEMKKQDTVKTLSKEQKTKIKDIGIPKKGRNSEEVTRELIEEVYPYRMKMNHPRYFGFIPNDVSPYSIFGDFINSMYNPYGGGYNLSEATATIENELIKWMGKLIGYDVDNVGGQFVSGGSMANLTATLMARDNILNPEEFIEGTAYVSDQTHSSVAKAIHIMGIPKENVRKIRTNENFKLDTLELERVIKEDIEEGYKPFLIVGTCGTTNTGTIDPLIKLGEISKRYGLWYHVDGAYGASALLSDYKDDLKGIELSDSVSWDGHKWLFQTYGCAAIICKDKNKLIETFHVNPEYLEDVESTKDNFNFWDMGIEMTKPARGMRLWFTLQTVGTEGMKSAINQGFIISKWIEEEVKKYNNLEIISKSQMGIINFRFNSDKYNEEELDRINKNLSRKSLEENYSAFLTTKLKGKTVLRFCSINPLLTRKEVKKIISDLQYWIKEEKY